MLEPGERRFPQRPPGQRGPAYGPVRIPRQREPMAHEDVRRDRERAPGDLPERFVGLGVVRGRSLLCPALWPDEFGSLNVTLKEGERQNPARGCRRRWRATVRKHSRGGGLVNIASDTA